MKRKWVKGVIAIGLLGCLLAGCASEKTTHVDGLDELGSIEVVTREEGSGTRSTFAEKAGITDSATGMDQIEVIVNKENPVQKISVDQLKKIYTGELTKWAQLNGAKEEK